MPIDYDPLDEGNALTANSLNTRINSAGSGVNDIAPEDIEREAFRREHLPQIIEPTTPGTTFEDGLSKIGPTISESTLPLGTVQVYNSRINSGVVSANYQVFGAQAPNAPYGPPGAIDLGWRILAFNNVAAEAAEISLGAGGAGITLSPTAGYRGLLVKVSASLLGFTTARDIDDGAGNISHLEDWKQCTLIGIGYEDAGGRHVIERSVRWYSVTASSGGSIETFTFINWEEISQQPVLKVFGVVSTGFMTSAGPGVPPTSTASWDPQIGPYNIDVLPVRSGELVSGF